MNRRDWNQGNISPRKINELEKQYNKRLNKEEATRLFNRETLDKARVAHAAVYVPQALARIHGTDNE